MAHGGRPQSLRLARSDQTASGPHRNGHNWPMARHGDAGRGATWFALAAVTSGGPKGLVIGAAVIVIATLAQQVLDELFWLRALGQPTRSLRGMLEQSTAKSATALLHALLASQRDLLALRRRSTTPCDISDCCGSCGEHSTSASDRRLLGE